MLLCVVNNVIVNSCREYVVIEEPYSVAIGLPFWARQVILALRVPFWGWLGHLMVRLFNLEMWCWRAQCRLWVVQKQSCHVVATTVAGC